MTDHDPAVLNLARLYGATHFYTEGNSTWYGEQTQDDTVVVLLVRDVFGSRQVRMSPLTTIDLGWTPLP